MAIKTDITLYTEGTPNGLKISIALEELGLEYKVHSIDLTKFEQKEPWFLEINPNGRIPALTDKDEDGNELKIFESGAILEYLVSRYDKDHRISYLYGSQEHWETTSWLMWQMAGLGPMQGQANHFARFADAIYPYALNRYVNESRRLYRILDTQIAKNPSGYIVGDRLSIADIACWPWVCAWKYSAVPQLSEFPNIERWMHRLLQRPGFEKGRNVPGPHYHIQLNKWSEEEMNDISKVRGAWVLEGMKNDAEASGLDKNEASSTAFRS